MERKFLKYTLIAVIFFIGLSMGVNYQEKNSLDNQLDEFESVITEPNNDFTPVNPTDSNYSSEKTKIDNNIFTSLARDGEYVLKKGIELILDKSDDFFRFIFGIN